MRGDAFVEHVLELLAGLGPVSARRMFGGHGIFLDGRMFALIADGTLYLKTDDASRGEFERLGLAPFTYARRGKPFAMSYHQAPEEALESAEAMREWAELAVQAARRAAR